MPNPTQQIAALIKSKLIANQQEIDRGQLIILACQSSCAIEAARRENGIPPTVPAPWPASTWEFQKLWTQRIHHAS